MTSLQEWAVSLLLSKLTLNFYMGASPVWTMVELGEREYEDIREKPVADGYAPGNCATDLIVLIHNSITIDIQYLGVRGQPVLYLSKYSLPGIIMSFKVVGD